MAPRPDRALGRRSRPEVAPRLRLSAWTSDTNADGPGSWRCTTRRRLRTVEGLGELGHHIVSFVYGDLYTQPALTDRDRELGAVVALTALGRSSQLPQHLRAALHAGLSEAELREAIMLTASIAGFPPAMNAIVDASNVLAEQRARRGAGTMRESAIRTAACVAKTLALLLVLVLLGAGALTSTASGSSRCPSRARPCTPPTPGRADPARARRSRLRRDDRAQRRHVPGHPPRLGRHAGAARPTVRRSQHRPWRRQDRDSGPTSSPPSHSTRARGRHLHLRRPEPGSCCPRFGTTRLRAAAVPPIPCGSAPTASNRRRRSSSPALRGRSLHTRTVRARGRR